jgi:hypothetical protein
MAEISKTVGEWKRFNYSVQVGSFFFFFVWFFCLCSFGLTADLGVKVGGPEAAHCRV